jgi:hypothetical protein
MSASHHDELLPSKADTVYSKEDVCHPPTNTSPQDRLTAALSQFRITRQTQLYSIVYILTIRSETITRVSGGAAPHSRLAASQLTASHYFSNVD